MNKLGFLRKLMLPLVIAGAAAGVLVAYTYLVLPNFVSNGGMGNNKEVSAAGGEHSQSYPGPIYVLKERVVNLADAGGRRYLKIAISLEFAAENKDYVDANPETRKKKEEEFTKELAPKSSLIDDAIISILTSKTSSDLSTSEGKERVKTEIRDHLNAVLHDEKVLKVYFTQFLIQ